jgi:hypothetical protein
LNVAGRQLPHPYANLAGTTSFQDYNGDGFGETATRTFNVSAVTNRLERQRVHPVHR